MTQQQPTSEPGRDDRGRFSRGLPAAPRALGWADLGIVFLAAIVLYAVGIVILRAIPDDESVLAGIAAYLVSGLAPLGAVLITVVVRGRDLRVFGWRRVHPKWLLIGAAVGVGVVLLSLASTGIIATVFEGDLDVQADYRAAANGGALAVVATLLAGAVLTPLGEEALFRGVLANFLGRWGAWVAVPVSAVIFAVAHGLNFVLPVALIVGVCTALLFRRTGSIWPGVIVHLVNNGTATLLQQLGTPPAG